MHLLRLWGFAHGIVNKRLQLLLLQLHPQTATDEFLDRWGLWVAIIRLTATRSTGIVTFQGAGDATVPINTNLSSGGITYHTTTAATVSAKVNNVASITRTAQTATVTTSSAHNLASSIDVVISGADQAEYNIATSINVLNATQFTYTVTGSPTTPATGTIIVSHTTGFAEVKSGSSIDDNTGFGSDTNQDAGAKMTLLNPIANVNNNGYLQSGGAVGGGDREGDVSFRNRVMFVYQGNRSFFNADQITSFALQVPGVTRVFVQAITPAIGQTTVYFLRDNDDDGPIPSAAEVQELKDALIDFGVVPATIDRDNNFIVAAPTPVVVDFDFASITPDTPAMREAISNNIAAMFRAGTSVGQDMTKNQYTCAIFGTIETKTGETLSDFALNSPIGDIAIASNEIPILGDITF